MLRGLVVRYMSGVVQVESPVNADVPASTRIRLRKMDSNQNARILDTDDSAIGWTRRQANAQPSRNFVTAASWPERQLARCA